MRPEPVTGEALAARYLAVGERAKNPPCEVCGEPCIPDDNGRAVHPTCEPETLR